MAKVFEIECKCGELVEFETDDVEGLERHIKDLEEAARDEAREGFVSDYKEELTLIHGTGERHLRELASAIRSGRREDAEYHLDQVADAIGGSARHEVDLGRYSPAAKAA